MINDKHLVPLRTNKWKMVPEKAFKDIVRKGIVKKRKTIDEKLTYP